MEVCEKGSIVGVGSYGCAREIEDERDGEEEASVGEERLNQEEAGEEREGKGND